LKSEEGINVFHKNNLNLLEIDNIPEKKLCLLNKLKNKHLTTEPQLSEIIFIKGEENNFNNNDDNDNNNIANPNDFHELFEKNNKMNNNIDNYKNFNIQNKFNNNIQIDKSNSILKNEYEQEVHFLDFSSEHNINKEEETQIVFQNKDYTLLYEILESNNLEKINESKAKYQNMLSPNIVQINNPYNNYLNYTNAFISMRSDGNKISNLSKNYAASFNYNPSNNKDFINSYNNNQQIENFNSEKPKFLDSKNFLIFSYDDNYLNQKSFSSSSYVLNNTNTLSNSNFSSELLKRKNEIKRNITSNTSQKRNSNFENTNLTNNTFKSNNLSLRNQIKRLQSVSENSEYHFDFINNPENSFVKKERSELELNRICFTEKSKSFNFKTSIRLDNDSELNNIRNLTVRSQSSDKESSKTKVIEDINFNIKINLHKFLKKKDDNNNNIYDRMSSSSKRYNKSENSDSDQSMEEEYFINNERSKRDIDINLNKKQNKENAENNYQEFPNKNNITNVNHINKNINQSIITGHFRSLDIKREEGNLAPNQINQISNNKKQTSNINNNNNTNSIIYSNKRYVHSKSYPPLKNSVCESPKKLRLGLTRSLICDNKKNEDNSVNNKNPFNNDNNISNPNNVKDNKDNKSISIFMPYSMSKENESNLDSLNINLHNSIHNPNPDLIYENFRINNCFNFKNNPRKLKKYNFESNKIENKIMPSGEILLDSHLKNIIKITDDREGMIQNDYKYVNNNINDIGNFCNIQSENNKSGEIKKSLLAEWKSKLQITQSETFFISTPRKIEIEINNNKKTGESFFKQEFNKSSTYNEVENKIISTSGEKINPTEIEIFLNNNNNNNKYDLDTHKFKNSFITFKTANYESIPNINMNSELLNNLLPSNLNKYKNSEALVFVVIDDNLYIRESVSRLLQRSLKNLKKKALIKKDFQIIEGSDGVDALKFLIDPMIGSRVRGIFIDENMEYMNGSETIKIIRKFQSFNKIQKFNIATVTAFEDQDTRSAILLSGVDEIFPKPLSRNNLEYFFTKYPIKE